LIERRIMAKIDMVTTTLNNSLIELLEIRDLILWSNVDMGFWKN